MQTKTSLQLKRFNPHLNLKHGYIELSHGSGGLAMKRLIEQLFLSAFDNKWLAQKNDQACFDIDAKRMVMTTDSYVISPLFFPGGNIGSLSVHGTINDIVMSGAKPLYLSAGFIIEEGFPLSDLTKIVYSMANAARMANVAIITGDTKVVERGKGDGLYINTTGIGILETNTYCSSQAIKTGDKIIISGTIGDHGVAVLSQRENLSFTTKTVSDSAALNELVELMVKTAPTLHCLRDPTRGGLATTLNELAEASQLSFVIDEAKVPIRSEVKSACELLGLDPLYIANEGKLVAICPASEADQLLNSMRLHPLAKEAELIGEVIHEDNYRVQLKTQLGGNRILDWLTGDQLPRIC